MSSESVNTVDVDVSANEIRPKNENKDANNQDALSVSLTRLSNSDKILSNFEEVDIGKDTPETMHSTSISSPKFLSLEVSHATDNLVNKNEICIKNNSIASVSTDIDASAQNSEVMNVKKNSSDVFYVDEESRRELENSNIDNLELDRTDFEQSLHSLTTSTVSLNEGVNSSKNNIILSKSLHSKSAENICITVPTSYLDIITPNSSSKDLDAGKILQEFNDQKVKVQATQKIVPETTQTNLDIRYPRIPKELLNQDLGSIVKNVHGIFSSVSGSLKYAYNISHNRVHVSKPPPKGALVKSETSSKIIDEIFEEEAVRVLQDTNTEHKEFSEKNICMEQEIIEPDIEDKKLQVESLEQLLDEHRNELTMLKEKLRHQTKEIDDKNNSFKELEGKIDLMRKRVTEAEREKDAAVMRYASSECAIIEARRSAEMAAAKERAATSEVELLNVKLKSAHGEKQRICQLYDDKCHELQSCERELGKVREELKELEGRLKWTQNKLRTEMDAYKDSVERVQQLQHQVSELESAREAAVVSAADTVRANLLESELKECRAALILCRHENGELEKRVTSLAQQLDACTKERDDAASALARTTHEVESLRESNVRLEEEAASLAALRARAALADTLSSQLQRECDRASQAEEALIKERARAETCARREAAALEHAAKVTAQHVAERATCSDGEAKVQALSADNASLRSLVSQLECQVTQLQTSLAEENDRRNRENRTLARKVAELSQELSDANNKLEWEKGENSVLKKKHASAVKEISRELHRALKRCEQLEAKLPTNNDDDSHRAGSVTSLSSGEGAAPTESKLHNGHATDNLPDIQVRSPDKQALIERIVSLQRAAARRSERCDFLEEHSRQLTDELRNKSRLLRQLLCAAPAGALADNNREQNKSEIARLGGGAMAAVWGGDPAGMTLELSLEMNKRLQAVLEDTLLKNITLKENMDTLGKEIARLKGTDKQTFDSK